MSTIINCCNGPWFEDDYEAHVLTREHQEAERRTNAAIKEAAYLHYLDDLRDSGVTNMFGAGAYLEAEFDLSQTEARTILAEWMQTFSERQKKEG